MRPRNGEGPSDAQTYKQKNLIQIISKEKKKGKGKKKMIEKDIYLKWIYSPFEVSLEESISHHH